jgi:hypothetical protein
MALSLDGITSNVDPVFFQQYVETYSAYFPKAILMVAIGSVAIMKRPEKVGLALEKNIVTNDNLIEAVAAPAAGVLNHP